MSSLWLTSHLLLWFLVLLEGLVIVSLLRQVGTLILRVGPAHAVDAGWGPQIGELAPWAPEEEGHSADARHLLLAFMSTACGSCRELVPALNAVASGYGSDVDLVAVGREVSSEIRDWARARGLEIPVMSSPAAFEAYKIGGTPYAFILDRDRRVVARGGVNHIEHIEALLRQCGSLEREDAVALAGATAQDGDGDG